ncbi:hypothetical protein [Methylorubrum extorquens]|uniref:hypothetical protein n=1 Tax=Methylorubrum extorquens TaxID=408 RepID=UPI00015B8E13|nr:hypothetical protein [Methylorubrum extorquens]
MPIRLRAVPPATKHARQRGYRRRPGGRIADGARLMPFARQLRREVRPLGGEHDAFAPNPLLGSVVATQPAHPNAVDALRVDKRQPWIEPTSAAPPLAF